VRSALLTCLLALLVATPAAASVDQESILQDDPLIVYPRSETALERTFVTLRTLGVDRVRVSVFWLLVAPRPNSERRPSFGSRGASWPDSYPRGSWDRYDDIVRLAEKYDIGLLFTLTGPAPDWAAGRKGVVHSVYKPRIREFKAFVTAVGRRYSGTWIPEGGPEPQPAPNPPYALPLPIIGQPPAQPRQEDQAQAAATSALPRVDHWSLWNEGNFPSWLAPQSRRTRLPGYKKGVLPYSPHLYRRLVDAGWEGLQRSGHVSDVILLGETAPRGGRPGLNTTLPPLKFLRELYCLDADYRPFRSSEARARRCPDTRAERHRFRRDHPGLFAASGWAHHPYSLDHRPSWRHPSGNSIPLGSINRLVRAYDRARFAWGDVGQGDIWVTEYGYQTAPDPYVGIPLVRQALWTTWAEFIAYRNPRIASMAQFLLNDDAPDNKFDPGDFDYWRTWQSGLATNAGTRKPAFDEYPYPIHVTPLRPRRGRSVRVFGIARPAPDGTPLVAHIQGIASGGDWVTLKKVDVTNVKDYVDTRVRPRSSSELRILWTDPIGGGTAATRSVGIKIR
jgi:hypothetical protein